VSLLLKRRFAQEFVKTRGRRVQKVTFRLTCVAQKRRRLQLPNTETQGLERLFREYTVGPNTSTFLAVNLLHPISKIRLRVVLYFFGNVFIYSEWCGT